jgi:hypothetical protein
MAPSGVPMAYSGNNDEDYLRPGRPENNRSCRPFSDFRRRHGQGFTSHSDQLQPANPRATGRHFWVFGLDVAHGCPTWHPSLWVRSTSIGIDNRETLAAGGRIPKLSPSSTRLAVSDALARDAWNREVRGRICGLTTNRDMPRHSEMLRRGLCRNACGRGFN